MAICLLHSQEYNPNLGEFCPYCGSPRVNFFYSASTTGEEWKNDKKEKTKNEKKELVKKVK